MLKTRKCTPVNYINFEGVLVGYVRAKAIVPLQDSNVNHAPCPRTVQQQTLAPNRDRADSRPSRDHRAANVRLWSPPYAWKLGDPPRRSISRQRSPSLKGLRARFPWEPIEKRVERDRAEGPRDDVLVNRDKRNPALFRGTEITGWFSREKFRTRFLRRLKNIYTRETLPFRLLFFKFSAINE